MNYIKWNLSTEDKTGLYDPLGDFKILGDRGFVEEKDTYLDSFFEAFVEGATQMESENNVVVDPFVEPDDIVFNCNKNEIEIIYGTQKALILNKNKFLKNLQNAITDFLRELDKSANDSEQPKRKLTKLRNFLLNKIDFTDNSEMPPEH